MNIAFVCPVPTYVFPHNDLISWFMYYSRMASRIFICFYEFRQDWKSEARGWCPSRQLDFQVNFPDVQLIFISFLFATLSSVLVDLS